MNGDAYAFIVFDGKWNERKQKKEALIHTFK